MRWWPQRSPRRTSSGHHLATVVAYAGDWVDEVWVRSTIRACSQANIDVALVVSAPEAEAPNGIAERYAGVAEVIASGDGDLIERLRGKVLLSATTSLSGLPFHDEFTVVHMPHSLVSLHVVYPPDAFDTFDVLFASGPHHISEFGALSGWRGLGHRPSVAVGYGKLDVFRAAGEIDPAPGHDLHHVLLAPSWGPGNVLDRVGIELCASLLAAGARVTLRPHPLPWMNRAPVLSALERQFGSTGRLLLESPLGADSAIFDADVLVTDYSGVAMEFAAIAPRPIVFVDVERKVANPDWEALGVPAVEIALRGSFGRIVDPEARVIADAALSPEPFDRISQQRALQEVLFDGPEECGARAAQSIAELLTP